MKGEIKYHHNILMICYWVRTACQIHLTKDIVEWRDLVIPVEYQRKLG